MLRAAIWGTGRMGTEMVRTNAIRHDVDFVAAIVFEEEKEGRDLGDISGVGPIGAICTTDTEAVLGRDDLDLVFYTGVGNSAEIAGYCTRALAAGKDVVTLSGLVHPATALGDEGARALDEAAKKAGARFVGTGVAPGFVVDVLPVVLLSQTVTFERVIVRINSGMRGWGPGVLRAYGIGSTPDRIVPPASRVSMKESIALVGESLNLGLDRVTEINEPRLSKSRREFEGWIVEPGTVTGFHRRFSGWVGDRERVALEWNGAFELNPTEDGFDTECSIEVEADALNHMNVSMDLGLWGDPYPATAARGFAVVPGLRTLPPGAYHGGQVPFAVR
jgi:hypothetical protein